MYNANLIICSKSTYTNTHMQQKKERERENTFECKTLTEQTKMIKEKERYSYAKRRKKKETLRFLLLRIQCARINTFCFPISKYRKISLIKRIFNESIKSKAMFSMHY